MIWTGGVWIFSIIIRLQKKLWKKNLKFDGVFGVDRLAIECMNGLLRQHKKIPEEVKIVSYDGTYIYRIGRTAK